ncbi:hypothetical protein [Bifidobacterium longum]|nr:hypothetical protein [Bifidobacterium longum]KOP61566.1 hypothetical protein BLOI2_2035 [Bifidobacterium longum subsp. longum]
MRKPEKGPRGGLVVWLMAVIVISQTTRPPRGPFSGLRMAQSFQ